MAEADGESARIQQLIADIDSLCTDERWDAVVELRDTCRLAVARGHQWWPAAAWAEYRLALDGPGRLAASVLDSNLSRYTLGPFAEVAASTHSWDELVPYLEPSPASALFAHECVALGDDLRTDDLYVTLPQIFDAPAALEPWEPEYGPVVYHLDRVEHLAPILLVGDEHASVASASDEKSRLDPASRTVEDLATCDALAAVLAPWAQTLRWTVLTAAVDGDARVAHALWMSHQTPSLQTSSLQEGASDGDLTLLDSALALRYVAWLGASGGPNGRRRGLAASRSALWWVLLQVTGIADDLDGEPITAADRQLLDAFAASVESLRWFTWTSPTQLVLDSVVQAGLDPAVDPDTTESTGTQRGWSVHLAVEAPAEGITWLLAADSVAVKAITAVTPGLPRAPVA